MSVPLSAAPNDPYQWSESVMSTRSLSYVSNADALASPRGPSRNTSCSFPRFSYTHTNTLASIDDMSDAGVLEMHRSAQAEAMSGTIPEHEQLPTSVAACPLFRLPREIREHIYSYLVASNLGISYPTERLDRHIWPEILRTASPIYHETAPLLYHLNKLIFSHPSDANMFRHAIASTGYSAATSTIILRIKNSDVRLWTAYFNSLSADRSLVKDFPALKHLTIRFRGPRYQQVLTHEANAMHWIRDPKLKEVIESVRKCAEDVHIEVCVKVPDGWQWSSWEAAVVKAHVEAEGVTARMIMVKTGFIWLHGVWLKLETEGT